MKLFKFLVEQIPAKNAFAHCDIPCGVYDVHGAQIAAHTVIRMTKLLSEVKGGHDIARLTHVKEKHGALVEEELGTLQNDYFKEEHYTNYPELVELLIAGVKHSIKVRQNIDLDSAQKLLEITQNIAEIFYKTKDFEPIRVPSGYPTGGEIVTHK